MAKIKALLGNFLKLDRLTGTVPGDEGDLYVDSNDGQLRIRKSGAWVKIFDATSGITAADIANVPSGNLLASDVQAALNELQSEVDPLVTGLNSHVNATAAHGATGEVMGTTNIQTVTNKTVGDKIVFIEQGGNPATPAVNQLNLYAKDENGITRLYEQAASGFVAPLTGEVYYIARNTTGVTLTKGQVVYVNAATGATPEVALSIASNPATIPAIGVVANDIANLGFGRIVSKGTVDNFNTSAFTEGAVVYVSDTVAGAFTATKPAHPSLAQRIGIILNSGVGNGRLEVDNLTTEGNEQGTRLNDFKIGDNTAGAKSLTIRNGFDLALQANPTANRTLTLPDVTDTLAVQTDVDINKNSLNTGVLTGGAITINAGDNTKFDVSAGTGLVVDHTTSPPTVTEVSWGAFTAVTVTNLATAPSTDVAINVSGGLVQQSSYTSAEQRAVMLLGGLDHNDNTIIRSVFSIQVPAFDAGLSVRDLARAVGDINKSGNVYSANGVNLNIDKSAGVVFSFGRNTVNSKTDPHTISPGALTALSFNYAFDNGSGTADFAAATTAIDPTKYDNGSGTPVAVGTNKFTVQRILFFPNANKTFIQYGMAVYNKLSEAKAAIIPGSFTDLVGLQSAITRGYLIVSSTATALNDPAQAEFVGSDRFGSTGGTGGAAAEGTGVETYVDDFEAAASWTGYTTGGANTAPNGTWTADSSLTVATYTDASGKEYLQIDKAAVSAQGKGIYLDFLTPEIAEQVYVALSSITSAAYVVDDVKPFIWDTGAANELIKEGSQRFTWQPSSGIYNYRLALHVTTANATAWTVKIALDHFSKEPILNGVIVTDTQSYTPDWTASSGTPSVGNGTLYGSYKRVGNTLHGNIQISAGSTTAFGTSNWRFSLPSGLTIDTDLTGPQGAVGTAWGFDASGVTNYSGAVFLASSTLLRVGGDSTGDWDATAPFTWASGDIVSLNFEVPILEWAGQRDTLSTTELMNVNAHVVATKSVHAVTGALVDITGLTVSEGSSYFDGTNFTPPETGWYEVKVKTYTDNTSWTSSSNSASVYFGGGSFADNNLAITRSIGGSGSYRLDVVGSRDFYLEKGQSYTFGGVSSVSTNFNDVTVSITRIPDFSVLGASGRYEVVSATSATTAAPASNTVFHPTGAEFDLTPGTWRLFGLNRFTSDSNTNRFQIADTWFSTSSSLVTLAGVTVLSAASQSRIWNANGNLIYRQFSLDLEETIIQVTTTTTIYGLSRLNYSAGTNHLSEIFMNAERLR